MRKSTPPEKNCDRELTTKDNATQQERNSSRCQAISNANTIENGRITFYFHSQLNPITNYGNADRWNGGAMNCRRDAQFYPARNIYHVHCHSSCRRLRAERS